MLHGVNQQDAELRTMAEMKTRAEDIAREEMGETGDTSTRRTESSRPPPPLLLSRFS